MHLKTDIFLEQTAVLESFSSTLISCSGSQNSSVSLTGLCLGMRQLTLITPWSPGGTSCSHVFWLSTGCSLFLSLPASQGIYMTPAELKQGIVFFCRATTIFLHPSVLETVIKKNLILALNTPEVLPQLHGGVFSFCIVLRCFFMSCVHGAICSRWKWKQ